MSALRVRLMTTPPRRREQSISRPLQARCLERSNTWHRNNYGGEQPTRATDLFPLALVLYEMVAGRRAFERSSSAQTVAALLDDDPPPLPALTPAGLSG